MGESAINFGEIKPTRDRSSKPPLAIFIPQLRLSCSLIFEGRIAQQLCNRIAVREYPSAATVEGDPWVQCALYESHVTFGRVIGRGNRLPFNAHPAWDSSAVSFRPLPSPLRGVGHSTDQTGI